MVKKFITKCDFGATKQPVTLFIGDSFTGVHPLAFQSKWLAEQKGGSIPNDIMDSFSELKDISDESKVSFEELCSYVVDEADDDKSLADDVKRVIEFSETEEE